MKFIFIVIASTVIYKVVLDNINVEGLDNMLLLDMLRNIGNIVLIMILSLSIRDAVVSMNG
jgi:hypothetical protein